MSEALRDGRRLRPQGSTLGRELAEKMRARIIEGEFEPGARLPAREVVGPASSRSSRSEADAGSQPDEPIVVAAASW